MPATAEILENGRILKYVVSDPWTMDDIVRICREGKQLHDTSSQRVHLLVDLTGTRRVPPGFLKERNAPDLNHPNSGHIALVGAVGVVRAMVELVASFFPGSKVGYYETEAEALAYIYGLINDKPAC